MGTERMTNRFLRTNGKCLSSQKKIFSNMAEQYDEVERRMGICAYAAPDIEGFSAVLKARYSDFCVHEGMPLSLDRMFLKKIG